MPARRSVASWPNFGEPRKLRAPDRQRLHLLVNLLVGEPDRERLLLLVADEALGDLLLDVAQADRHHFAIGGDAELHAGGDRGAVLRQDESIKPAPGGIAQGCVFFGRRPPAPASFA